MKRILLLTTGVFLGLQAYSQRVMDFEPQVLFPVDSTQQNPGVINFSFRFHNNGPQDFVNDTLYLSMTVNGVATPIQGSTFSYALTGATNISATPPSNYYQYSANIQIDSTGVANNDVCFTVEARNSANPITDPDLSNNEDCVVILFDVPDEEEPTNGIFENVMTDLNVWPNPTDGEINFNFSPDAEITVMSLDGKEVLRTFAAENKIDVSNLQEGMYVLHFAIDGVPQKMTLMVK